MGFACVHNLLCSLACGTVLRSPHLHPSLRQVHATTLPSGALLLAFDDSERLRTPLALAMSRNGGETWYGVLF